MTERGINTPPLDQRNAEAASPTPTEQILTRIVSRALRRQNIDVDSNFIELGGQSILAVGVINRVREALGVELPLQLLLDGETTVHSLSKTIDIARGKKPDGDEA